MTSIDIYITTHYKQWIDYASAQVRLSRLPINPVDVVNDVLCTLLERDVVKMERLIHSSGTDGKTELDFFVMRIIKISIHSPRSPFRYQRGQHCTDRLEDQMWQISIPISDFDYNAAYDEVLRVFNELEVSEVSKRVFAWRFIEGKPFSEWPGFESQKFLYETFNRILLIISARIRRKSTL